MKFIKLNIKIFKVMYQANKSDDFMNIKLLVNKDVTVDELHWMISNRLSLWRSLRTKDFYKVISRCLIELCDEEEIQQERLISIVDNVLKTTQAFKIRLLFCRHLVKTRSIVTASMIPTFDFEMFNVLLSHDFKVVDPKLEDFMAARDSYSNKLKNEITTLSIEIDDLRKQLELLYKLN